jgi:Lon protease-like protein
MADRSDDGTPRIPLFPLAEVVHFPRTELRLQFAEPRYRRMVEDVITQREEARWIGVVLLKSGRRPAPGVEPEIYPAGTAGRLMDAELLPGGEAQILLHGEFRFELYREVGGDRYREALVRPVEEPLVDERDAGIVAVRQGILRLLRSLAEDLGEHFPIAAEQVEELGEIRRFEELVNRIAAELDLPAPRKLQLLYEGLPERGLSVLSILRSRRQVIELLRPYRHLAGGSPLN